MFIVCRVVSGGRVLVPDTIKDVDERQSFGAVYLSNFDSSYCLQEVYLSEDSSGKNTIKAEPHNPVQVAIT